MPYIQKTAEAEYRSNIHLDSAIIAFACERFRLKHMRWPEDLNELVAKKYISEVPMDPLNGKPMRYKQSQNGIWLSFSGFGDYSGYDGQLLDNAEFQGPPYISGFHLWNPDKRRLPPRPFKVTENSSAEYIDVWTAGKDGYHTYRIPSLIATKNGTLLAFCEGRKDNSRDHGDIDLLVKRSTDNGKTWSKHQIVYEEGGDEKITIGNPCPVVDQTTGIIWLPFTRNNDEVLITYSKDDGQTWAKPTNITASVKEKSWTWYATGPGVGIQMQTGKYAGRLVIPCDHQIGKAGVDGGAAYSHVIYSDDGGKTWKLGGTVAKHTDECQVVELPTGELYLNMRNYWGRHGKEPSKDSMRAIAFSKDGGESWDDLRFDKTLIEPVCQASVIAYRSPFGKDMLLFSNPAMKKNRANLLLRRSEDGGKTWVKSEMIHRGPAAYSCLAALPDGSVGCLYEGGNNSPYEKIRFATLNFLTVGIEED